jgi:hypothetical protein
MKITSIRNLFVVVIAVGFLSGCGNKQAEAPPAVTPMVTVNATNPPVPAATANPAFEKLMGRWLRPDGGYVVEIRSVAADGKMDAGYFNPNPIHVAKAEASQEGGTVKVFIELRDVNYPGSTYTLAYDPAADQLKGIYYQALQQLSFEVFFERFR